jgi:APA family basic amino acid/polyamine antiporter
MTNQSAPHASGLGLAQMFTMSVGTIIGIGWITMLGIWLQTAGTVGAMLAFAGGAIIILPIALCYAELSSAIPGHGGEMAFARFVAGPKAGLLAGWLLLLTFLAVIAFEATSTGWLVGALFPDLGIGRVVEFHGLSVRPWELAIAILGMIVIALVNIGGSRGFARLQDFATYGKLAASAVFIAVGLAFGDASNITPAFSGSTTSSGLAGTLAILVTTPFWFSGFNAAAQALGDRARQMPLGGIGLALGSAILVSLAFYMLVILASSMAAPRAVILGFDLPAAGAFATLFGPGLAKLVLVAGLLGLISTWNAVMYAASHVLCSLAEAGALPTRLAERASNNGAPVNAIIVCAVLGSLGALAGRSLIGPVVNATGSCVTALFLLVALATLHLRRHQPGLERPYRVPGGIWVIGVAVAASAILLPLSLYLPFADLQGIPTEWLILGGWLILGMLMFQLRGLPLK